MGSIDAELPILHDDVRTFIVVCKPDESLCNMAVVQYQITRAVVRVTCRIVVQDYLEIAVWAR